MIETAPLRSVVARFDAKCRTAVDTGATHLVKIVCLIGGVVAQVAVGPFGAEDVADDAKVVVLISASVSLRWLLLLPRATRDAWTVCGLQKIKTQTNCLGSLAPSA